MTLWILAAACVCGLCGLLWSEFRYYRRRAQEELERQKWNELNDRVGGILSPYRVEHRRRKWM